MSEHDQETPIKSTSIYFTIGDPDDVKQMLLSGEGPFSADDLFDKACKDYLHGSHGEVTLAQGTHAIQLFVSEGNAKSLIEARVVTLYPDEKEFELHNPPKEKNDDRDQS